MNKQIIRNGIITWFLLNCFFGFFIGFVSADETSEHYQNIWNVELNVVGNSISVSPGESITISLEYQIWNRVGCPSCIAQIVIGIGDEPKYCAYDGIPGVNPGVTGSNTNTITAPNSVGTYELKFCGHRCYSCSQAFSEYIDPSRDKTTIGTIIVTDDNILPPTEEEGKINFAGYEWYTRTSNEEQEGPGENYWSNSPDNIWLDNQDKLHLNLTYRDGRWYCPEVYTEQSFGYGTYTFYLNSRVDNLPKNIVVGLFAYEPRGESTPKEYEIDIEFSTWNGETSENGHYIYQYRTPDNDPSTDIEVNKVVPCVDDCRFDFLLTQETSTHKFIWKENYLHFESYLGHYDSQEEIPSDNYLIGEGTWDDSNIIYAIPPESSEKVHLNMWCYKGYPPTGESNPTKYELVIEDFKFTTLSENNPVDNNTNDTPGFELMLFVITLALILLWKRKMRDSEK